MKHQRKRTQNREETRQKRKEAGRLRRAHDLCPHENDVRQYASESLADADTAPAKVCAECDRSMLVVKVFHPRFALETYQGVPTALVAQAFADKVR